MPAKSKAQQKFMGMVHAAQKGEKPASKEVAKVAKDMPKKAAKDFASTKHKGLPAKAKKSKAEESLLKDFEQAVEEATITQGPNKGKQWSSKTPGVTNPAFPKGGIDPKSGVPSPDDGATAPPPKTKSMKKAEVQPTSVDDEPAVAEAKQTYGGKGPKKTKSEHDAEVKKKKEKEKFKKMAETVYRIGRLEQMIMEAKKKGDGNLANNAKPYDKVTRGDVIAGRLGKDEEGGKKEKKVKEGNDGNLANNAKPYDKVTIGDVVAGRLGKDEMGGKKKDKKVTEAKSKCTCEDTGKSKCSVHSKKKDAYMESLFIKLQNQLNG